MPSKLHEIINRLLARIFKTSTEEFGLEVVDVGSTTLEREDSERGAEPDTGFLSRLYSHHDGRVKTLS